MRWIAFVLVLLTLSGNAGAQTGADAKEHYRKALAAYDLGSFADAAKEFEAAYAIRQDPSLLYNIGQSYRFAKESDKALLAYRAFLRRSPKAPQRAQVEQSITDLEKQVAEDKARREESEREAARVAAARAQQAATVATVVDATPQSAPKPTPVYKKWWLWTAVGGAVVIGLGVGLGVGLTRHETTGTLLPAVGGAQ